MTCSRTFEELWRRFEEIVTENKRLKAERDALVLALRRERILADAALGCTYGETQQ